MAGLPIRIPEPTLTYEMHPKFADLLRIHASARCIAVDIPIGLPENGQPRRCDLEARQILRPPRSSSVFPAPARCLLNEMSYATANIRSHEVSGKGLTRKPLEFTQKSQTLMPL